MSHGESNARGIMLCVNITAKVSITKVETDVNGRFILFDVSENDETMSCAAIYAPNKDTPEYYQQIRELMCNRSEKKNDYWRLQLGHGR